MHRSYHGETTLSDAKFLVDQIRRTFNGDSWHGPSLMKTLEGVDFEQAKDKPLHGRHSIWEIIDHVNFWMGEVSWALENNRIYDSKSVMDWPLMGQSEEDWSASVERLEPSVNRLVGLLGVWRNDDLDRRLEGATYSYRQMLNGVIHHNVYHAGQIAILKQKK